jgi:hypothetical protein
MTWGYHNAGIPDNGNGNNGDCTGRRTMTSLDVSSNNLGELGPPEGWRAKNGDGKAPWIHTDGRQWNDRLISRSDVGYYGRQVQRGMPEGAKPEGIIAIANAIPYMGALKSLNLSSNRLMVEGTKIVAKAIQVTNCCDHFATFFLPL